MLSRSGQTGQNCGSSSRGRDNANGIAAAVIRGGQTTLAWFPCATPRAVAMAINGAPKINPKFSNGADTPESTDKRSPRPNDFGCAVSLNWGRPEIESAFSLDLPAIEQTTIPMSSTKTPATISPPVGVSTSFEWKIISGSSEPSAVEMPIEIAKLKDMPIE